MMRFSRYSQFCLAFGLAILPLASALHADISLSCPEKSGKIRLEITLDGRVLLSSPPEGLWSVAANWQDDWPSDWHHASPRQVAHSGPWTVLKGELELPSGTWSLRDAWRVEGDLLRCTRRFTWLGQETLPKCTLAVRFRTPAQTKKVMLPGILYYGNPSGAKSGRVPVFHGQPAEQALFEEHRYPMPFASIEWNSGGKIFGAALHSLPSPVPYGNVPDQWWSLGVTAGDGFTDLTLLSGPCASNGKKSVIKAVQPGFVPYPDAYLNISPQAVIEKTFYLQVFNVKSEGSGFIAPVKSSLKLFSPLSTRGLPTFAEIIEAKYRFSHSRWYEADSVAGFRKFPDRQFLVMGWCGQAASLGYALQVLHGQLNDPQALTRAQKSLDFLTQAQFYEGGFHTWYDIDNKKWSHHEPLSQGQAMTNFAWAIRQAQKNSLDPIRWEKFLRRACDFHARRILKDDWNPKSTNEAFFIAPLCEAARLFDVDLYRQAAIKAGMVYRKRHLSMREPYWGGTLDARCEDKEGCYAAFQGFMALYLLTEDQSFLEAAEHALYAMLSYVVVWDIDLPPGRLRDHNFKTRGWTVVSPQNQHIDVYGVFFAPDIYQFGQITNRKDLKQLALVMFRTCGQLLDPYGSQGEQPQQTNYAQRGQVDDIFTLRGGYQESWTVFWITAHFLNAAARFGELGVDLGP